jgi:hypothetical protein
MKYAADRECADPEKAARKLLEIANTVEAIQVGRIHIEKINAPFLQAGGSSAEYGAGLAFDVTKGRAEALFISTDALLAGPRPWCAHWPAGRCGRR